MADELLRGAYAEYVSKSDGRISYPEFCFVANILTRNPAAVPDGWLPIESAPKDGTLILACDSRIQEWMLVVSWEQDTDMPMYGWMTLDGTGYHDESLTHWMPLPAPPQPTNESGS